MTITNLLDNLFIEQEERKNFLLLQVDEFKGVCYTTQHNTLNT
jgi:hypothetical protein